MSAQSAVNSLSNRRKKTGAPPGVSHAGRDSALPESPRAFLDISPSLIHHRHNQLMPYTAMPPGALALLILRVLRSSDLHGYAIAQRIHTLSADELRVEEGALYPALQRLLRQGLVKAKWGTSETNRQVRFYTLTPAGRKELDEEVSEYERVHKAIRAVLRTA